VVTIEAPFLSRLTKLLRQSGNYQDFLMILQFAALVPHRHDYATVNQSVSGSTTGLPTRQRRLEASVVRLFVVRGSRGV